MVLYRVRKKLVQRRRRKSTWCNGKTANSIIYLHWCELPHTSWVKTLFTKIEMSNNYTFQYLSAASLSCSSSKASHSTWVFCSIFFPSYFPSTISLIAIHWLSACELMRAVRNSHVLETALPPLRHHCGADHLRCTHKSTHTDVGFPYASKDKRWA